MPTPQGGRQHTILPNFSKNCMKLKEFGPPGGCVSLAPPLDPPLTVSKQQYDRATNKKIQGHEALRKFNCESIWVIFYKHWLAPGAYPFPPLHHPLPPKILGVAPFPPLTGSPGSTPVTSIASRGKKATKMDR